MDISNLAITLVYMLGKDHTAALTYVSLLLKLETQKQADFLNNNIL